MLPATQYKTTPLSGMWAVLMICVDLVAIIASFSTSMNLIDFFTGSSYSSTVSTLSYINPFERYYLYILISVVMVSVFMSHGHYTQRVPWWNQVRLLSVSSIFAVLLEGFASFVLELQSDGLLILLSWTLFFAFSICLRLAFFRIRKRSKQWSIPTVVIGDHSTTTDILYAFNADPGIGYDVHNVFLRGNSMEAFDITDLPKRYANLNIEHDVDNYEEFIAANPDKFYVVGLDTFRGIMRDKIVDALNNARAKYAVVPSTAKMSLYEMEPKYFFGFDVMLLFVKTHVTHPISKPVKRLMDIGAALTALILFSPLIATIVIALKIEGHEGSLFYGGERVGKHGKNFKCWKFRTMTPNSDHLLNELLLRDPAAKAHWEKYFKLPKDPRVKTRTARILRNASLDEVPQLWNVLTGDMSVVGPRPILPTEVEPYGETINEYIKVRPGITGLWQVSGRNAVSFQRRTYWDSWYVRNWSLWGDIVIILKTIPAVLLRDDGH